MLTNEDFKELGKKSLDKVSSIDIVYKYVGLKAGLDYILKDNTLKFTNPEDFNDPFDCHEKLINIVIDTNKEKEYILNRANELNFTRSERRKHLRNTGNPKNYTKVLKKEKKKFKVSCFSEVSDEILMWSHYADKHNGICIGFNFEPLYDDYVFYPVSYVNELQKIDGMANVPYVFYYMVTVKAKCWTYEKEIRAVSKSEKSILSYPKEAVKEVIFGCNVRQSIVSSQIKKIKKMGYRNIEFKRMEINPNTLTLTEVKIDF